MREKKEDNMDGLTGKDGEFNVKNLDTVDFAGDGNDDAPLPCGTLAIDDDVGTGGDEVGTGEDDVGTGDGDAEMKSDADDDGALGGEDDAGGFAQKLYKLTTEERLAWFENEVMVMRADVAKIKSRMADLIEVQNGMTAQPGNGGRNVVTAQEFEKMVDGALKSGMKYGVSRSYITRFLCLEYGQINNRYLQKKIGLLLKKKLTTKEYLLNDALYSINDK